MVIQLPIKYLEQNCKSILHKFDKPSLPFNWGANPYRGCLHSCIYCFARYTHSYLEMDPEHDFDTTIIVKKNAAKILRKELSKPKWKKELVNLGSICDPYQPIEREQEITRAMLKEFRRFRNPITIATKSPLITRDIDIIADMMSDTHVEVVISLSTLNEDLRRQIEPRTFSTIKRLQAVSKLRSSNIRVGVLLMPIIPYLNDSAEEIDALYKAISEAGANFVIHGLLYLIGPSKTRFLEFISKQYPELKEKFDEFYVKRSPPGGYKEKIHNLFKESRLKYNFQEGISDYSKLPKVDQKTIDQWFIKKNE
ncbi:MAG: radical SAM protein [Asgard group archaeon]|nr:radical SAM protein [Asgard group archaeon]